jgi:HEAT repeat protein
MEKRRKESRPVRSRKLAALIGQLTDASGHDARKPLRLAIEQLGAGIAPALSAHLEHTNCFTRWEVVSLLGQIADPDTLERVVEFALGEDEVHARWRSFWAVSRFDRDRTIPMLLKALKSRNWTRRWRAALMLSMMRRREAVPVLLKGLDNDDDWIQWEALSALKSLAPPDIEKRITGFLSTGQPLALRQEAILALAAIGSKKACAALKRALRDREPQVRWRASMGLARTRDPAWLPALRAALANEKSDTVILQLKQDIDYLERANGKT